MLSHTISVAVVLFRPCVVRLCVRGRLCLPVSTKMSFKLVARSSVCIMIFFVLQKKDIFTYFKMFFFFYKQTEKFYAFMGKSYSGTVIVISRDLHSFFSM